MSITSLIVLLKNISFLYQLPIKQPITVEKRKTSTHKSGIPDLIVTHYDYSPQYITNMRYYKLNKIGKSKIKPAEFQILPAQVSIFSQIQTLQVCAYAKHAKLSQKESFYPIISLKRGFRFDHDN